MTPDERRLAEVWLSEMWAPVREYRELVHDGPAKRERKARPKVGPDQSQPRLVCPFCDTPFSRSNLPKHLARVHSADYEEVPPVESTEAAA